MKHVRISVDVEADGPCPGLYSMVCFGAVVVGDDLAKSKEWPSFRSGYVKPISKLWIPEALAVSGISREEHLLGQQPDPVMNRFKEWVLSQTGLDARPVFVSDNPAFDWQFINYYLHLFTGDNPFGFSARRIGDFYAGLVRNWADAGKVKKHRITKHDHDPVNDARGNAEMLRWCLDNQQSET